MKTPAPKCSYPWCVGCRIPGAISRLHFEVNEQLKYATREEAFETAQFNCMEEHKEDAS